MKTTISSLPTRLTPFPQRFFWSLAMMLTVMAVCNVLLSPLHAQTITEKEYTGDNSGTIVSAAHGTLFNADGKPIEASADVIQTTLQRYIEQLLANADDRTRETYKRHRRTLAKSQHLDDIAADSLLVEWLVEAVSPRNKAQLYAINRTMRMAWYQSLLGEEKYKEIFDLVTGLPYEIAKVGESQGLLRKATIATGGEYIAECRKAGVPIPPAWRDEGPNGWQYVDDLNTNFVGSGNPASVYRYDSRSPAGMCVALPRINGDTISLLGIICLGTQSSNACFYDNANVGINDFMPIENFLSGGNLSDVCSDCHAGENPYVVHPGGPLNMAPDNISTNWYTPLVRPDWPHNPGPSNLLASVPINPLAPEEDKSCLACHQSGDAGRFPDIPALNWVMSSLGSTQSGYCSTVLLQAMGSTMPGGGAHQKHVDAMKAFCGQSIPPGGEVPPPDVPSDEPLVGPPIVVEQLYACAEAVEIRGAMYGATLTVYVNGVDVLSVVVTSPDETIVEVPALVVGDVVYAIQEFNGTTSDKSNEAIVIDHNIAYPDGLPTPEIDPTVIYECGHTIAVRHVRGAKVSVLTNGANELTYSTGGDWTNLPPAIRPFLLGDEYTVQQRMCKDKSDVSAPEEAGPPPQSMPVPVLNPSPPVAGQNLIHLSQLPNGASTTVYEASVGIVNTFATAVDRQSDIDVGMGLGGPISSGDQFSVVSELCESSKASFPEAEPCESLPAPTIATPLVGATLVHVTSHVPSAQIIVYDAALTAIGSGSGFQVGLTRPLVNGDVLTVIQRLEACTSATAYQVAAVCASTEDCG